MVGNAQGLKAFVRTNDVHLIPGEQQEVMAVFQGMHTFKFPDDDFRGRERNT